MDTTSRDKVKMWRNRFLTGTECLISMNKCIITEQLSVWDLQDLSHICDMALQFMEEHHIEVVRRR